MLYIRSLTLPDTETEFTTLAADRKKNEMTCYGSRYPFGLFPARGLSRLTFRPITVFAGGNGSGKSTCLNILAAALSLARATPYNRTPFFDAYVKTCHVTLEEKLPGESRIITSDDVFASLFELREAHAAIDREREELIDTYWSERKSSTPYRLASLADTDGLRDHNAIHHRTPSQFVNARLSRAEEAGSNGERALRYFTETIREGALYLLDEPENSLSAMYQVRLAQFLADSARFFGCQFIIATHSPILLALPGASVYDFDARPVAEVPWTELPNVRTLQAFFREHESEF